MRLERRSIYTIHQGGGAEWAAGGPRQARAVSGARRRPGEAPRPRRGRGAEATEGARRRELAAGGLASAPPSLRRGERAPGAAASTFPARWARLRCLGRPALKGGLEPRAGRHSCPSPGLLEAPSRSSRSSGSEKWGRLRNFEPWLNRFRKPTSGSLTSNNSTEPPMFQSCLPEPRGSSHHLASRGRPKRRHVRHARQAPGSGGGCGILSPG